MGVRLTTRRRRREASSSSSTPHLLFFFFFFSCPVMGNEKAERRRLAVPAVEFGADEGLWPESAPVDRLAVPAVEFGVDDGHWPERAPVVSSAVGSMNIARLAERQADEARDEALSARRALAVAVDALDISVQHSAQAQHVAIALASCEQVVEARRQFVEARGAALQAQHVAITLAS